MSQQKNILIAEDEQIIGNTLQRKLENEGYEVTLVKDGKSAIDSMSNNSFDLLILDIIMPVLNGFEVLKHLQKNKISTPVIVSTNLGQEKDIQTAKDLGATEYFIKAETPLTEVVEQVKRVLA